MMIMFNLEDCLAFIANRSSKIIAEAMENEFRPYHMTRSQWIALHYIFNNDHITQRKLAEKMGIKEPSVVRLLQKLELDGLLYRSVSSEDKRIKQLELSVKGSEVYHELLPIAEKFMNNVIEGISEEDLQTFMKVMEIATKKSKELLD